MGSKGLKKAKEG